jgi:hypothetical protein
MSALGCPFWCLVHRDGVTLADRPHEGRPITVEGDGGELVSLALLQDQRAARARLEVDVDGRTVVLPLDAAQTLIHGLRELHGMAQRAGASA